MREVRRAGLEWSHDEGLRLEGPGVQLNEWERDGWTYHAKGSVSTRTVTVLSLTSTFFRDLATPQSCRRSLPDSLWVDESQLTLCEP